MAGFETVTKEIDGRVFEMRALPAKLGRRALVRLTKRLAPIVGHAVDGVDVGELMSGNVELGGALERLGQELTEDDVDHFCDLFAAHTSVENPIGSGNMMELKPAVFDEIFSRRYPVMLSWLRACLEVNFGGFFGEGGMLSALTPSKLAASK
jgi:hypothetical protein